MSLFKISQIAIRRSLRSFEKKLICFSRGWLRYIKIRYLLSNRWFCVCFSWFFMGAPSSIDWNNQKSSRWQFNFQHLLAAGSMWRRHIIGLASVRKNVKSLFLYALLFGSRLFNGEIMNHRHIETKSSDNRPEIFPLWHLEPIFLIFHRERARRAVD